MMVVDRVEGPRCVDGEARAARVRRRGSARAVSQRRLDRPATRASERHVAPLAWCLHTTHGAVRPSQHQKVNLQVREKATTLSLFVKRRRRHKP